MKTYRQHRARQLTMTHIPLIDRTYVCQKRDGTTVQVNCFNFNLAHAAGSDRYLQCEDGSWIRPSFLAIVPAKAAT